MRKNAFRTQEIIFNVNSSGKINALGIGTQAAVALNETDISVNNAHKVIHLGDASFEGTANSQLQVTSSGLRYSWTVPPINSRTLASYDNLCIFLTARGVQTSSGNRNTISLADNIISLPDTSPDGLFTLIKNCFPISKLSTMRAQSSLTIVSGNRGASDYDDFEVANIWGRLEDPNNATNVLPTLTVAQWGRAVAPRIMVVLGSNFVIAKSDYVFTLKDGYFPLGTKRAIINWGDSTTPEEFPTLETPNGSTVFLHAWSKVGSYTLRMQYIGASGNILGEYLYPLQVVQ